MLRHTLIDKGLEVQVQVRSLVTSRYGKPPNIYAKTTILKRKAVGKCPYVNN